jgi:hypothetical protein
LYSKQPLPKLKDQSKKYFSIKIPTKQYLKRYIEHKFGTPVIFNESHFLGMALCSVLDRTVYANRNHTIIHRAFDKYTSEIIIHLPLFWIKKYQYGFDIDEKKAVFLNKFFESMFEEDLYKYCYVMNLVHIERKKAMEEFCLTHGIEPDEDITWDNLIKTEYRYRKSFEEKQDKQHHKLSCLQPEIFQGSIFENYNQHRLNYLKKVS